MSSFSTSAENLETLETNKKEREASSITYNTIVEIIQKLSLAPDLETIMFIVRKAARKFANSDGATFVLKRGNDCFYAAEDAIAPLWQGKYFPMSMCVSGWVMQNKQSAIIEDIFADSRVPIEAYRPTFVKSLAMVPIRSSDPIGAIGVYWDEPIKPSKEQINLLTLLADSTSIAMENIRLKRELQEGNKEQCTQIEMTAKLIEANESLENSLKELTQRQQEMKLLKGLTSRLQTCLSINETYEIIEQEITKLLPNSSGQLYVLHNSRNYLEIMTQWGKFDHISETFIKPDSCLALRLGTVQNTKKKQCIHYHEDSTPLLYSCTPLLAQSDIIGLLCVEWELINDESPECLKNELILNSMISEQIALGISNIKLRETLKNQSLKDTLTGLYNRRYIEECLERGLQQCARNKTTLGIMMIDIDHFKQFNDMFGHGAGDKVIIEIGSLLNDLTRTGSDIASRYGGEEFLISLPEISIEDAFKRAEDLRKAVEKQTIVYHGTKLPQVTISVGLSLFPDHATAIHSLLESADKALYQAKNQGRNRVLIYKP